MLITSKYHVSFLQIKLLTFFSVGKEELTHRVRARYFVFSENIYLIKVLHPEYTWMTKQVDMK